jgi:ATP-binding cassette subfamily B protein
MSKASESQQPNNHPASTPAPTLFGLLNGYRPFIALLIALAVLSNGLNLVIPKIVAAAIDAYTGNHFSLSGVIWEFASVIALIFLFAYLQTIVQTFASERVARDLRNRVAAKISHQNYASIQDVGPSRLLTNLTSDVDAVKSFVSQAIVSIISSVLLIVGASVLLLLTDWKLALAVLVIVPVIAITFGMVLIRVRALFKKSQGIIDWLNKVINESILGAAVIRVLNAHDTEHEKFTAANTDARNTGMQILALFSALIPIVTFVASMGGLIVLALGGHFVVAGSMSIGNLAAFSSYITILIFPIFILGFMSNVIAQASASYSRVLEVLVIKEQEEKGERTEAIRGDIEMKHVSVIFGSKPVLKDVSFSIKGGTRNAIIGPTAAGKTQLLYLLTGLLRPNSGTVDYDGHPLDEYDKAAIHRQVGFVFQDSIIFNMSLRENIAFNKDVTDVDMGRAIDTAELKDFVDALPEGLDTIVSERGASLSGGQKQRIMLARALALNPRVLLLDDFTARVDNNTEKKILDNVHRNYPGITLLSVTQKVASVEHYDKIILLMEGEILATGTHEELLASSPEYVQIYESQKSTNVYELQA